MSIAISSGLLFVNLYNSIVDEPNWGHQIPQSIDVARSYFTFKNPAEFFKFTGPLLHIVGINCVIRFWKTDKRVRWYNIIALCAILFSDLLTMVFIFPLNEVLFGDMQDITIIQQAFHQWDLFNWFRSFALAVIPVMYSLSLNRYLQILLKGI